MKRILTFFLFLAVLPGLRAEPAGPAEAKLREALRNTMLQLRAAQADKASLQAAQAESDQAKAALQAKNDAQAKQVEGLIKQGIADKAAADKKIAELTSANGEKETQIAQLNDMLAKWKTAYNEAAETAKTKEAERFLLSGELIMTKHRIEDDKAKNIALYKLGSEILTRYEKFGLGDALGAREPFTGLARVKLENLVQDYQDKLADQRIVSDASSLPATSTASTSTER